MPKRITTPCTWLNNLIFVCIIELTKYLAHLLPAKKKFSISFILLSLNYGALSTCGWIQKIIHNYFIILFEVACCKWVRKISETFVFEDKINKPNAKASIHYWIRLYCESVCFDIFVTNIFFISVEMCLTPKLSRYLKLLPFTCKDI